MTVAVLYCDPRGVYSTIPDVELWGLPDRNAMLYAGPHPVVAHPPCSRWCRLAGLVEARWGHRRGDDGGTFAAALAAVRRWGGVLEHPAYSDAWPAFGLPRPSVRYGGWRRTECGGAVCSVDQGRYGHPARKATWLYAHGAGSLPPLMWGSDRGSGQALVGWCANNVPDSETRPRVGKRAASATPPEFAAVLVAIAESARLT